MKSNLFEKVIQEMKTILEDKKIKIYVESLFDEIEKNYFI